MEPRARVELATCRLRNECFFSISFAVYLCPSLSFAPFRPGLPAPCATVCAMLVVGQFPITALIRRLRGGGTSFFECLRVLSRHRSAESLPNPCSVIPPAQSNA